MILTKEIHVSQQSLFDNDKDDDYDDGDHDDNYDSNDGDNKPMLDFQKSRSSDFIWSGTSGDFVARGRPRQKRLAPLAKRSTCSKSKPMPDTRPN